eukprot:4257355-Prorocentrum_lima.AAC.1
MGTSLPKACCNKFFDNYRVSEVPLDVPKVPPSLGAACHPTASRCPKAESRLKPVPKSKDTLPMKPRATDCASSSASSVIACVPDF